LPKLFSQLNISGLSQEDKLISALIDVLGKTLGRFSVIPPPVI
jgi:hypothetical protein